MDDKKFISQACEQVMVGIKMENGKPLSADDEVIFNSCLRKLGYKYMFRSLDEVQQFSKHLEESTKFMRENFGTASIKQNT